MLWPLASGPGLLRSLRIAPRASGGARLQSVHPPTHTYTCTCTRRHIHMRNGTGDGWRPARRPPAPRPPKRTRRKAKIVHMHMQTHTCRHTSENTVRVMVMRPEVSAPRAGLTWLAFCCLSSAAAMWQRQWWRSLRVLPQLLVGRRPVLPPAQHGLPGFGAAPQSHRHLPLGLELPAAAQRLALPSAHCGPPGCAAVPRSCRHLPLPLVQPRLPPAWRLVLVCAPHGSRRF